VNRKSTPAIPEEILQLQRQLVPTCINSRKVTRTRLVDDGLAPFKRRRGWVVGLDECVDRFAELSRRGKLPPRSAAFSMMLNQHSTWFSHEL